MAIKCVRLLDAVQDDIKYKSLDIRLCGSFYAAGLG